MLSLSKPVCMGFIDVLIGILLAYGLFRGLKNGLFVELAAIVALIAGLYGAIHFSYIVGDYLSRNMEWNEKYIHLIAVIITFVLIVFIVHLAGKLLTKIASVVLLGFVNKIAGALFGALKVAVILGGLLVFFDRANTSLNLITEERLEQSIFYPPLRELGGFVFENVLKDAKEKVEEVTAGSE